MSKEKKRILKHIELYKQVGENIKRMRKEKNMSQEKLGFEIQSTRNYIGCVERAEKFPSIGFIFDVAQALDTTPKELFDIKF